MVILAFDCEIPRGGKRQVGANEKRRQSNGLINERCYIMS